MSLADSFSFGGISRTLCVRLTAISSSDWSGLPGTRAGPESPPLSAASRESSRKPPSALSGPWHDQQREARSGWTRSKKKRSALAQRRCRWHRRPPAPRQRCTARTRRQQANSALAKFELFDRRRDWTAARHASTPGMTFALPATPVSRSWRPLAWNEEFVVVQAERREDRGVQVAKRRRPLDRQVADFIGGADALPGFTPPPASQIVKPAEL